MTHRIGSAGLLWTNGKQDTLVFDAILVFVVCVLAISLAVAFCSLVLPEVNAEMFHGGSPGPEPSVARWSALGQLFVSDGPGDQGSELAEAFACSLKVAGQGWTGLLGDLSSTP